MVCTRYINIYLLRRWSSGMCATRCCMKYMFIYMPYNLCTYNSAAKNDSKIVEQWYHWTARAHLAGTGCLMGLSWDSQMRLNILWDSHDSLMRNFWDIYLMRVSWETYFSRDVSWGIAREVGQKTSHEKEAGGSIIMCCFRHCSEHCNKYFPREQQTKCLVGHLIGVSWEPHERFVRQ